MSKPSYAERDKQFDAIINLCDQQVEELRVGKRHQDKHSRLEVVKKKIEPLLNAKILNESRIVKSWDELKDAGFPVSFSTDLTPGDKEIAAKSESWYRSEDVFCILDKAKKTRTNVNFSNLVWVGKKEEFETVDPKTKEVKKVTVDPKREFLSQFEEAVGNAKKNQPTVMPINLRNKHWVAGMLRKNAQGKLEFLYNDSFGTDIDNDLKEWISGLHQGIEIVNLGVAQQHDKCNCGPYMIHNLLALADNKDLDVEALKGKLGTPDPKKLREAQGEILGKDALARDEAQEICDKVKQMAVCGKMMNMYEQFKAENKMEGDVIKCDDNAAAKKLAEQIKQSYEDIGVKPCILVEPKNKGGSWIVRLPEACRGRDPFAMSSSDLQGLREELKAPSPSNVFTKLNERLKNNEQGAGLPGN